MTGNPARQTGWISEAGIKLNFNTDGLAICPQSRKAYKLENGFINPVR
jgi:UDP-2-acetamido-3-amino-2,3-dideoxy-glucuronate N-acetyltransferase